MIAQELISGIEVAPGALRCGCCRRNVADITALRDLLSDNFMNADLLDPETRGACAACAYCFRERSLRTWSFYAIRGYRKTLRRGEVLEVLLSPPRPPFVFCVTRTMKKHNAFRAVLALDRERFPVRAEDRVIWIDRVLAEQLARIVHQACIEEEISKRPLLTGHWTGAQIKKLGMVRWREIESALRPYRGTALLDLIAWATVKPKEEENGDDTDDSCPDAGT